MGLDTTHDAWHGPYSSFALWREKVAKAAGIPLGLMEGFYEWGEFHEQALQWLAPREGGPLCGSYLGPVIFNVIEHQWTPWFPIRWEVLRPDALHALLDHSDCEGEIAAADCAPLADRLEEILPLLDEDRADWPDYYREKTRLFIDGLRLAASRGESVGFH